MAWDSLKTGAQIERTRFFAQQKRKGKEANLSEGRAANF